ncbi:CHAD domain-containing protein [Ciceribacter sp. L1K22]|uniref:CHAD domain-containing protein n=1 Tax=Ciceribacter sp. L1K22 TaxID=2820275 RepID=UPI001ABE15CC|nr:CHAD domain-containing protein [Ciceribacter sp. L1K22]MBO3762053.1 CHAD domain-containing protein [Ciceribacter sp. L1K22]
MPYRIRPRHAFAKEIRRIVKSQLEKAVEVLEQQPSGIHEAVHEARKKFKRVRGLYRLVARGRGDFRRIENARLRDTARALSAVRDAGALVETVSQLEARCKTEGESQAVAATLQALRDRRDRIAAAETGLSSKVATAIAESRQAIDAINSLELEDAPRDAARHLKKAWTKTLAGAHEALDGCHHLADPEKFHELRKSAQTYWMCLSLLRDIWPSAIRAKRTEAKALVDALGHEHDISILATVLDEEPGLLGDEELSHLLSLIIRSQQEIRQSALAMADRVFADEPKMEARVIAKLWSLASKNES